MADIDFGDSAGAGRGRTATFIINWTGGLLSLALVVGLGAWSYRLMVRDVSGVPVVRALEGPVRVAPDDPGGQQAAYQGLAVNEVAAAGPAGGPPEAVALAPAPQSLTYEDLTRDGLKQEIAAEMAKAEAEKDLPAYGEAVEDPGLLAGSFEDATEEDDTALSGPVADGELALADDPGAAPVDDAPADVLATDLAVAEALGGFVPSGDARADAAALAALMAEGVDPIETGETARRRDSRGLVRSPRPMVRPAGMGVTLASARIDAPVAVQSVSAQASPELPAATLAAGTRLVQLGAYDSADLARKQWQKIGARFEGYFDGKSLVVQQAESGGKTFYRLRAAGFDDLSDARRFCSALVARQTDCIPVVVR